MAYAKISAAGLQAPLVKSLSPNDADIETKVVAEIIKKLEGATSPVLILDGGGARGSWGHLADTLVDVLKIPYFVTVLGKGVVDESNDLFGGAYLGGGSWPKVIKAVESSDCVLWLGNYPGDFNTWVFLLTGDVCQV